MLWPYSSWEDERFQPLDGLLTLDAQAGPGLKLGYLNEAGWVGYVRDGAALIRRFAPLPERHYPDLGCNVEVYVGDQYLELELLGPLTELAPGATVAFTETWEVHAAEPIVDAAGLRSLAARIDRAAPASGETASRRLD